MTVMYWVVVVICAWFVASLVVVALWHAAGLFVAEMEARRRERNAEATDD